MMGAHVVLIHGLYAVTRLPSHHWWLTLTELVDRRRDDAAGEALSAVPTPASTTAAGLAARLGDVHLLGIEDGIAEVAFQAVELLPARRRTALRAGTATIDLDGTDVQC
jgi:hypothetical protein